MPAPLRTAGKVALPLGVAALAAGAIAYGPSAFADDGNPRLPTLTAEDVVAKIAASRTEALSGSVRLTTDLGLPALPGGRGDARPSTLLGGTHTMQVAVDGPDRQRIGIQAQLSEYNIIHNGRDVWTYDSRTNTATHRTLPGGTADAPADPTPTPDRLALTPQDAARQLLAAAGPGTRVTVDGTAAVAGRDAYRLRIAPAQPGSLIGGVTVSVDAETGVPLRVVVDTAKGGDPAVDIGFTEVSFRKPDADTFAFKPPSGAKVVESNQASGDAAKNALKDAGPPTGLDVSGLSLASAVLGAKTHGEGWATVVELPLGTGLTGLVQGDAPQAGTDGKPGRENKDGKRGEDGKDTGKPGDLAPVLAKLGTPVSGPWGSGTVFSTRLATALATDDGRVFVGMVDSATLQRVAAESAAGR